MEELRGRKTDNGKQTQPPQASKDAPTQAPTQPEKPETSPTEHNEHGHVTHSAEEASLVRSMVAQGKSPQEIDAALKSLRTNMAGERSAVTSEIDPLSPVLEHDKDGNEVYYRTMAEKHFQILETKGKLVGTGETSTSPIEAYAQRYDGVLVKITVKKGTSAKLQEIGVAADGPAAAKFPQMHTNVDNWNEEHARFKVEVKGNPYYNSGHGVMNTQLGNGSALKIFQDNLIRFEVVRKGKGSKKVQD